MSLSFGEAGSVHGEAFVEGPLSDPVAEASSISLRSFSNSFSNLESAELFETYMSEIRKVVTYFLPKTST